VRQWSYSDHKISLEEHGAFIDGLEEDIHNAYWLVQDNLVEARVIGVISLKEIDWENKSAFLGIYVNPEITSPGVGQVLMRCLKDLSFSVVNLDYLRLEVIVGNTRAIDFYKRSGFKEISRIVNHVFRNGKSYDAIIMEINRSEV
jgi:UDP-4-amino-4,6-dideoxy-N-acetyl-beta-L-altrosamine N-acetyltransferase